MRVLAVLKPIDEAVPLVDQVVSHLLPEFLVWPGTVEGIWRKAELARLD